VAVGEAVAVGVLGAGLDHGPHSRSFQPGPMSRPGSWPASTPAEPTRSPGYAGRAAAVRASDASGQANQQAATSHRSHILLTAATTAQTAALAGRFNPTAQPYAN